jgi:hypothetical protein
VEKAVWAFTRNGRRFEIRCEPAPDGALLVLTHDHDEPRTYFFASMPPLISMQAGMEAMLMRTGWAFESFSPDRRTGRDRRGLPRIANDRRRWWTDGVDPPHRRYSKRGRR